MISHAQGRVGGDKDEANNSKLYDPRFLKPSRLLLEAQQRSEFGRFRGGATQDQVMPPDSTDKKKEIFYEKQDTKV